MTSPLTKPVLAASLVATSILTLSYLWLKSRQREQEENSSPLTSSSNQPALSSADTELQLDQVQERLHCIRRTRLDTLEEEPVQAEPEPSKEQEVKAVEEKKKETKKVPVYFGSTDIRYRHLESNNQEFVEQVVEEKSQPIETDTEQAVEVTQVSEEQSVEALEKPVEVSEIQVEDHKMTVEMSVVESASPIPVPDVISALNDPLCGSGGATPPGSDYSSSPVKSESAVSIKSSCEWSDLIEQDEKELQEFRLDSRELTCKLSGLEIGSGRSNDSGVASPSEEGENTERSSGGSKSRTQSGEDPGLGGSEQGDEVGAENSLEDCQLLAYHFHIPETLCGKLIGVEGTFINELKKDCSVNIHLREISSEEKKRKKLRQRRDYSSSGRRRNNYYEEPTILKLCAIEGTRSNIDRCLNKLRKKFYQNPEMTFDQVNQSRSVARTMHNGNLSLGFAEGVMHDVFVSSIVGGGHIFLQQPCHPTYFALERLDQCMNNTYSQFNCPGIPQPVILNSVCAAPCDGGWFRCQVVSHDEETGSCDVKFLDYGGYSSLPVDSLKQIRTDFLSLPFQAIECYLANIQPEDDQNVSAFVLEELVSGQVVQARMIGTNEQGVPMVHLYRAVNGATTMVNRELVDRECATWLDTTIVNLDSPLEHPSNM